MSTRENRAPDRVDGRVPSQRNADGTRKRILEAAQALFSARGYASVGVREISAAAQADPTLIRRYFGSKEKLFEAALADLLDVTALLRFGRENFGTSVVDFVVGDPEDVVNPLPMLIYAAADVTSRKIAQRLLDDLVISPIGAWLGPPDGDELAARITMLLSGMFLYWQLLPLRPLADDLPAATRTWLSDSLQAIVDRKEPGTAGRAES